MDAIEAELEHAQAARTAGNEGRARVCARRAAGWAIRRFYQKPAGAGDALKQLERLKQDETLPAALRQAAARLTTPVNHDHALPFPEDPLLDARRIIEGLADAGRRSDQP